MLAGAAGLGVALAGGEDSGRAVAEPGLAVADPDGVAVCAAAVTVSAGAAVTGSSATATPAAPPISSGAARPATAVSFFFACMCTAFPRAHSDVSMMDCGRLGDHVPQMCELTYARAGSTIWSVRVTAAR